MDDRKKDKDNNSVDDGSIATLESGIKNLNFVVKDESLYPRDDINQCSEVWDFENHWSHKFTDTCNNTNDCICSCICPCCFLARLFRRTGECFCMFFLPGSLLSLRSKLRSAFRIKGSLFRDCVAVTCCSCCSAIQMKLELDTRGF